MRQNMRKEVEKMIQNYTPEFRKKIVRLHEEQDKRTSFQIVNKLNRKHDRYL